MADDGVDRAMDALRARFGAGLSILSRHDGAFPTVDPDAVRESIRAALADTEAADAALEVSCPFFDRAKEVRALREKAKAGDQEVAAAVEEHATALETEGRMLGESPTTFRVSMQLPTPMSYTMINLERDANDGPR